jgi:hypothetical protein
MTPAATGLNARYNHLLRASQCAGEAFAYADESRPTRSARALAAWLGIGVFAALAIFAAL